MARWMRNDMTSKPRPIRRPRLRSIRHALAVLAVLGWQHPEPSRAQAPTGVITEMSSGAGNLIAPTPLSTFVSNLNLSSMTFTPAGGTTARTLAALGADDVNIASYGAVGDMTILGYTSYTIAASSTALSATAGLFTPAMVGKTIVLPGAGAAGAGLVSVISGYTDSQHVKLATAAGTALSGVNETPEIGTDDTVAINNAIAAAETRTVIQGPSTYVTGSVYVPDGTYLVRSVNLTNFSNSSLRVFGQGMLFGVAAGYPVVDTLGSRWIRWDGVGILGDQYSVPSVGLQLGRTANTSNNSSDNSAYANFLISGYFTKAAMLNEQSETTKFEHIHFYNNQGTGTYGVIMDGPHHFAVTSMYATDSEPADTPESFDENVFINCIVGAYTPFWIADTNRMNVVSGYSVSSGPNAVVLYSEPGADNLQLHLDLHMEDVNNSITDAFLLTGTDPQPYLEGFHWNDNGNTATNSIFRIDPASSITAVAMPDADVDLTADNLGATRFFNDPAMWSLVSGRFHEPNPGWMNIATFQGQLSSAVGETDYATPATAAFQAALAAQGLLLNAVPAGVNITTGGNYYAVSTSYTPTVAFAAPANGTTATGHVSTLTLEGEGSLGAAGTGYAVASNVPVEDPSGNKIFTVNITRVGSNGVISALTFNTTAATFTTIPATPLSIVQSGGSGGTVTSTNFAVAGVAMDSPGSGYTSLPAVTFSSTSAAPAASGTAIPTNLNTTAAFSSAALTVSGASTFGGTEAHGLATGLAASSITLPASGTAPTGATQLVRTVTVVTACSTAAAGSTAAPLQLPAGAQTGSTAIRVLNRSGGTCAVYPPGGGTIEGGAANVPVTIAGGSDTSFVSLSATAWDE